MTLQGKLSLHRHSTRLTAPKGIFGTKLGIITPFSRLLISRCAIFCDGAILPLRWNVSQAQARSNSRMPIAWRVSARVKSAMPVQSMSYSHKVNGNMRFAKPCVHSASAVIGSSERYNAAWPFTLNRPPVIAAPWPDVGSNDQRGSCAR